jgi:hypothetical protein
MTTKWDPKRYKDDYKSALMKIIESKAENGDASLPKAKRPRRATQVIDLTDVLRKSLSEIGGASGKHRAKKSKPKRRKGCMMPPATAIERNVLEQPASTEIRTSSPATVEDRSLKARIRDVIAHEGRRDGQDSQPDRRILAPQRPGSPDHEAGERSFGNFCLSVSTRSKRSPLLRTRSSTAAGEKLNWSRSFALNPVSSSLHVKGVETEG